MECHAIRCWLFEYDYISVNVLELKISNKSYMYKICVYDTWHVL